MQKIVDVSVHNGRVDWTKVRKAGVHAIIRCGYGQDLTNQDDKEWERNWRGAEAAGVPYGVYLYSYANTVEKAKSEARHVLRLIKNCKLSYPVFFDSEEPGTEKVAKECAKAFCQIIEDAGYIAGVYASQSWWQEHLGTLPYVRWVAKWSKNEPVISWQIWQYSNHGKVDGVPKAGKELDVNWCKVDYPALIGNGDKPVDSLTVDQLADQVIAGAYSTGKVRKEKLGEKYDVVQAIVNKRYKVHNNSLISRIAKDVINGKYGNGDKRRANLGSIYEDVQKRVNELLK